MLKKLSDIPIKIDSNISSDKIYLITPATNEEIAIGNYIDIGGIKISSNLKKHAVIENVKIK